MQSRPALSPPGTDRRRARPTGVTVIDMQELRSKLEELGLDSTGLKLALVERLEAALGKAEQGVPPATTATADNPRPAPELDPAPSAEVLLFPLAQGPTSLRASTQCQAGVWASAVTSVTARAVLVYHYLPLFNIYACLSSGYRSPCLHLGTCAHPVLSASVHRIRRTG